MKRDGITGQLKTYLDWPLAMTVMWVVLTAVLYFEAGRRAAFVGLVFGSCYFAVALVLYARRRPRLRQQLIRFAAEYGQFEEKILQDFLLPYALLDTKGNVLWMNDAFMSLTGKDRHFHRNITVLFPDFRTDALPREDAVSAADISAGGQTYRAEMKYLNIGRTEEEPETQMSDGRESLIALCLFDDTELLKLRQDKDDNMLAVGILCLDNYDEALEGVEEVRRSLLLALVERKINKYFSEVDGIVRRLEHDKYFFFLRKKALTECEEEKFRILDDIKTVNIGNELSLTLSAGIGLGADSYIQNAETARAAMELALGRGGDQIVVKEGYKTRFFGGKSESTEKMTRVKARVKAHALKEIIESKDRVVVMGHKLTDIDALGAAIGIARAAMTLGKSAHIVADDIQDSLHQVISDFQGNSEYGAYMFVDRKVAKDLTDAGTALVVVDTNRASYTACEELLHRTNTIVVLDHHRQSDDRIQNAVLSYIEPYASSACEMVAEVLQYFDDSLRLRSIEADVMYAGIVIDTNNFQTRTGVRTFEAAAYLRRNGADITKVRKMFRDDLEDCRAKALAVADAEIFDETFAISVCPAEGLHSPTVVSAQAANELLNIVGVQASFVLTDYNNQIYISARAIDEVNVQLIMERLGGGGHLNIAGAQLADTSIDEARKLLKNTIAEMKQEGDI